MITLHIYLLCIECRSLRRPSWLGAWWGRLSADVRGGFTSFRKGSAALGLSGPVPNAALPGSKLPGGKGSMIVAKPVVMPGPFGALASC